MARTDESPTSRTAKRLATRERLFEAALVEFAQGGVAAGDVRTIVQDAGVAHGTFFFHFPTKEHVLAELGQREEGHLAEQLDAFLSKPRSLSETLTEVVRLARALERRIGDHLFNDMVALYFSPTRPELAPWSDHPLISRVVNEFDQARRRGEISDDPSVDPASAAIFFFMGFFALCITFEQSDERTALLDQNISTMLRGLAP